jgi:hypothetical protein
MFASRGYEIARETTLKARIKELENILCPAEQHDFALVDKTMHVVDAHGTTAFSCRYVCKRCLKVKERDEFS